LILEVPYLNLSGYDDNNANLYNSGLQIEATGSTGSLTTTGASVSTTSLLPYANPESDVATTGSITSGQPTLTVASATGIGIGDLICVTNAGASGEALVAKVTNVVSTTVTLDTNAGNTVSSEVVRVPALRYARKTFIAPASGTMVIGFRRVTGDAGDVVAVGNVVVREVGSDQPMV